jgi:hypothetical protein
METLLLRELTPPLLLRWRYHSTGDRQHDGDDYREESGEPLEESKKRIHIGLSELSELSELVCLGSRFV